jgi:hypothetical protein
MQARMEEKTVTFEFSDADLQKVKGLFPRLEGALPEVLLSELIRMSLEEWVNWLSGEDRPLSVTDQNTKRVLALYKALYPTDVPDAVLLYNDLRLPLGQARYIAQAISYQRGTYLQILALQNILRALHTTVDAWQRRPNRGDQERFLIKIPASSENAYLGALKSLALNTEIAFPVRKERLYDYVTYLVETTEWKKIVRAVAESLDTLDRAAAEELKAEYSTLREAFEE